MPELLPEVLDAAALFLATAGAVGCWHTAPAVRLYLSEWNGR